jgi:Basic region leucine zipper
MTNSQSGPIKKSIKSVLKPSAELAGVAAAAAASAESSSCTASHPQNAFMQRGQVNNQESSDSADCVDPKPAAHAISSLRRKQVKLSEAVTTDFVRSFFDALIASGPAHTEEQKRKGVRKRELKRKINRKAAQRKRQRDKDELDGLNQQVNALKNTNQNLRFEHEQLLLLRNTAQRAVAHLEGNNHFGIESMVQNLSRAHPPSALERHIRMQPMSADHQQRLPRPRETAAPIVSDLVAQSLLQPPIYRPISNLSHSAPIDFNNLLLSQQQQLLQDQLLRQFLGVSRVAEADGNQQHTHMQRPSQQARNLGAIQADSSGASGNVGTVRHPEQILNALQSWNRPQPQHLRTDMLWPQAGSWAETSATNQNSTAPNMAEIIMTHMMQSSLQQQIPRSQINLAPQQQEMPRQATESQLLANALLLGILQPDEGSQGENNITVRDLLEASLALQQRPQHQPAAGDDSNERAQRLLLALIQQHLSRRSPP